MDSQVACCAGLVRGVPVQSYQHLVRFAVLAGAFLLSVVLNNVALRFIPVSFVEVRISQTYSYGKSYPTVSI